jgi:hypothetical protein
LIGIDRGAGPDGALYRYFPLRLRSRARFEDGAEGPLRGPNIVVP